MAEKSFEDIRLLIQGCLQADREAQRKLYQYFYSYAMSICVRYSKSNEEAREVLNDGFMKVFTKIERYDSEKSFKGWLRRVMINTALDNYRHNYKHYHHRDLEEAEQETTTETITHQLSHADLMHLIQQLSPGYRAVFNLYAIDGYTHEEISGLLDISVGTSKSNLSKARANLQAMLKKVNRMNSRNMPEEEELDNMFRQAADLNQPEFDPEAWREMEKKLDAANRPKSAFRKWSKRSLLLLLLLGLGLLVYYYNYRGTSQSIAEKTTAQAEKSTLITTPEAKTKEKPQLNTAEPRLTNSAGNNINSSALSAAQEKAVEPTKQVNQVLTEQSARGKLLRYRGKTKQKTVKLGALNNLEARGDENSVTNSSNKLRLPILSSKNEQQASDTTAPSSRPLNSNLEAVVDSAERKTEAMVKNETKPLDSAQLQAVADSTIKKSRAKLLTKLSLTLVLGPDFSTVRFVKPEKASTNVGVLVSYHVSNRWTIATGLVRARKVYGAKPEDYHPGDNYWKGQHLPDGINAVCKVLDIPVNVRYALVALPRQAVYVQTGLSSYLMLHEDYRYDYDNYGKPYSRHWIVANQNKHFFQMLNLSAGYSRQIKPGIWVGAEPFVKIPLAGIGAGKVNLTSMGAFFTLNYRFR